MIKFLIKSSFIFFFFINTYHSQQLSKKMGSHVNGEKYRGSYKNGLKDGFGEWAHPDGDNYRFSKMKDFSHLRFELKYFF